MSWSSISPDGTRSVKANESIGQGNTTYIETKMKLDHFWNEDADKDGHHDLLHMAKQASDPTIATNLDGTVYLKDTVEGRTEGFYKNGSGIYQFIPSVLTGTVSVSSGSLYSTVSAIPANTYGEIFMYTTALGKYSGQTGFFRSDATSCESWSYGMKIQGTSPILAALKFANGSEVSGLNIRARRDGASSATWNYIITYRDL